VTLEVLHVQELERHAGALQLDVHRGGIGQRPARSLRRALPIEPLLERHLVERIDVRGVTAGP
jgi:hypothetical protein